MPKTHEGKVRTHLFRRHIDWVIELASNSPTENSHCEHRGHLKENSSLPWAGPQQEVSISCCFTRPPRDEFCGQVLHGSHPTDFYPCLLGWHQSHRVNHGALSPVYAWLFRRTITLHGGSFSHLGEGVNLSRTKSFQEDWVRRPKYLACDFWVVSKAFCHLPTPKSTHLRPFAELLLAGGWPIQTCATAHSPITAVNLARTVRRVVEVAGGGSLFIYLPLDIGWRGGAPDWRDASPQMGAVAYRIAGAGLKRTERNLLS